MNTSSSVYAQYDLKLKSLRDVRHTHNLTIMSLFHVLHGNSDLGSISARNEYMNEKQHVMLMFGPVGYKTLIDLWWLRSVNREGML